MHFRTSSHAAPFRTGLTLLELVAVMGILVALAAAMLPLLGSRRIATITGEKTPEQIVTERTMQKARDVIMGTESRPGVWADLGQRPELFPRSIAELCSAAPPAYVPANLQSFKPVTRIGWRGPYFIDAPGRDALGRPTLLDAWGNVIEVQFPDEGVTGVDIDDLRYVRFVSPGGNRIIETHPLLRMPIDRGDDVVLFLRTADLVD